MVEPDLQRWLRETVFATPPEERNFGKSLRAAFKISKIAE
jgi:hypothetical protein